MGLKLDARAGCLFFAFLMIAGKKWNLNPANVMPEGIASAWSILADYGFLLLAAAIAVYAVRPYYEQWMDARHKRQSMASATDKSRVQILEAERNRIREEQQRRHEQRTAEKAAEDEEKQKQKVAVMPEVEAEVEEMKRERHRAHLHRRAAARAARANRKATTLQAAALRLRGIETQYRGLPMRRPLQRVAHLRGGPRGAPDGLGRGLAGGLGDGALRDNQQH